MEYDGYLGEKLIAKITPRAMGEPWVNHGCRFPYLHGIGFTRPNQSMLIGFFKQTQAVKERKWMLVLADVRGKAMRDEAQRTFAYKASLFQGVRLWGQHREM